MFGSGAIDNMISSIRKNRALVGYSKGIYSDKYRKLRKEYKQKADKIHPGKPLTEVEKAKIKLEIRQDHIKSAVRKAFFTIITFSIVVLLIAMLIQSDFVNKSISQSYEVDNARNEQKFYNNLLKGKEALHKRSYSEAVYLLEKALEYDPENEEAELWLSKSYFYWSHNNQSVYLSGKRLIDSMAVKHPEKQAFLNLKTNFPLPK